ncbi:hypothetical protein D3C78_1200730 [compost metagenome]
MDHLEPGLAPQQAHPALVIHERDAQRRIGVELDLRAIGQFDGAGFTHPRVIVGAQAIRPGRLPGQPQRQHQYRGGGPAQRTAATNRRGAPCRAGGGLQGGEQRLRLFPGPQLGLALGQPGAEIATVRLAGILRLQTKMPGTGLGKQFVVGHGWGVLGSGFGCRRILTKARQSIRAWRR